MNKQIKKHKKTNVSYVFPFSAMDGVLTWISGQLISLTKPIHGILGQFVNKPQNCSFQIILRIKL